MKVNQAQINRAVAAYPRMVTGPMSGCKHPEAVLRYALAQSGPCSRLAANYVRTLHGACWNAMANALPADGWLVWYAGDADQGAKFGMNEMNHRWKQLLKQCREIDGVASAEVYDNEDSLGFPTLEVEVYRTARGNNPSLVLSDLPGGLTRHGEGSGEFGPIFSFRYVTLETIKPLRETATSCGPVLRGEVKIHGEPYCIECDRARTWLNIIAEDGACESCVIDDENQLFSESGEMLSEEWGDSDWNELAKFAGIEME